jgi:hypothetical protein
MAVQDEIGHKAASADEWRRIVALVAIGFAGLALVAALLWATLGSDVFARMGAAAWALCF